MFSAVGSLLSSQKSLALTRHSDIDTTKMAYYMLDSFRRSPKLADLLEQRRLQIDKDKLHTACFDAQ